MVMCHPNFDEPRCGRFIADNALGEGDFRTLQYAAGMMTDVGQEVNNQIVWDLYKNTISWKDFKPKLDPSLYSAEEWDDIKDKTFPFRLAHEAFGDDKEKMREAINAHVYDMSFGRGLMGVIPQTIINVFGAYNFYATYPVQMRTNLPGNKSESEPFPEYSDGDWIFGHGEKEEDHAGHAVYSVIYFLNSDAVGGECK